MGASLNVAVVGVGNWGRNVLRSFAETGRCNVRWVCDADPDALRKHASITRLAQAKTTTDFDAILADDVDAVAIATSVATHFDLASRALRARKHVFVEKPLCLTATDADRLVALARDVDRKLMVGHLLLYHACVDRLHAMIAGGQLGRVYYMYTQRINLGVVRQDENAWWSLAPHDVSVVCKLFGGPPASVAAHGQCYLQPGVEDVVFATLRYADGRVAHLHVSWLDPHKIRKMTVVGTERMVTFDDMEAAEKIRVYDKGADVKPGFATYARAIAIRSGDITIPHVQVPEPLRSETQHFVDAVLDNKPVRTDGSEGARVVRVLEAGADSIRRGGSPVDIPGGAS